MTQHWKQLSIISPQANAEQLIKLLEEQALSVSVSDGGDQELFQLQPQDTPLWEYVKITALFNHDDPTEALIDTIKHQFTLPENTIELTTLTEKDWVRLTQSQFPPQCFGENLWVYPSWQTPPDNLNTVVRIDPGLAFGTGTHATTALCLEWLSQQSLHNKTVIDFGCGSGILALSALALGAKTVYAIDHDPQAITATQNNAKLNHYTTENNWHICDTNNIPDIKADIIIANILANPLCELAPQIASLATDQALLVLSGILTTEVDTVLAVYKPNYQLKTSTQRDNWVCLILE